MAAKAGSRPTVNIGNPFTYDFGDRLTGITAGGTSTSYRYDPLGQQVSRAVNGATTGFYPDGDRSLVEKGPGGTTQYTWGNGLIRVNGEYPLTDGRGDVRLTTNAAKQVTSSNTPDAFGVGSSTANTASPFQWNAGAGYRTENLAPLGLSYAYSLQKVGARYYDPALGCFLTRDTALGEKPYAYCDGDPVNFSDPSGHMPKWLRRLLHGYGAYREGAGNIEVFFGGATVIFAPLPTKPFGAAMLGAGALDIALGKLFQKL